MATRTNRTPARHAKPGGGAPIPERAEQLALLTVTPLDRVPAWRRAQGPPVATVHDPRCWLDPQHHALTPCTWPASNHPDGGSR